MKYVSLFSGVEAASAAWEPLGWTPMAFSEIEPFPCQVLKERFPDVPNLGDITKIDWGEFLEEHGKPDLVVGGSPCFPAGALVLRSDGFVPIEDIKVGDLVLTHKGHWRHVLKTGSKVADTIILKGGGSIGIECTPNHPFWSDSKTKTWIDKKHGYHMIPDNDPKWVEAKDMEGRFWFTPTDAEYLPIPEFEEACPGTHGFGYLEDFSVDNENFWYFVGRWLGDGWANSHQRKGRKDSNMKRVYVCCGKDEAFQLERKLARTGLHFCRSEERTTYKFVCSSTQLYDWLFGNFGIHCDGKNMPGWVLSLPVQYRKALFEGYIDADGNIYKGKIGSSSINRKLTVGMKMLAGSLGVTSCVSVSKPNRDAEIEGRKVNERPLFVQRYYESPRSAYFGDGGWFGLVRKVKEGNESVRVYNLEVEGDNSYTVDGIAVHNCQSFSVAGGRDSLDGESRLMFEFIRAVDELRPEWMLWENVPGALSAKGLEGEKGGAFHCLLSELSKLGYGLAWRVLDAQYFGVAQRRRRVFLVGCLGDPERAGEVLFEPDCVCGNPAPSREPRQGASESAEGDAGRSRC